MPKRNRSSSPKPSAGEKAPRRTEFMPAATCPDCGKRAYASKQEAKRGAARIYPGVRMRFYQCGQWWHMTSQGAATTARYREAAGGTTSGPSPARGMVQDLPAAEVRRAMTAAIGDRVTGWHDGTPYAAVILAVEPHHPGCGDHLHIIVRCEDGTEMETFTDAVVAAAGE
jgi:hypothetical protein